MPVPQSEVAAAQENLRVIRGLMERATVYRTISVPVALVGGALAIAVTLMLRWLLKNDSMAVTPVLFLSLWFGALLIVAVLNTWLIYRGAKLRNEPFISSGMRVALTAFAPACVAGGIAGTAFAWFENDLLLCSVLWLIFYGLALMATGNFSPQSIGRLGLGFLAFGLIALIMTMLRRPNSINDANVLAATLMGAGFGVLHLAYGLSVFLHSLATRNQNQGQSTSTSGDSA
jgi:hypothetical protein